MPPELSHPRGLISHRDQRAGTIDSQSISQNDASVTPADIDHALSIQGESHQLAPSVRRACDEMNRQLTAAGFDPPGDDIAAWSRLAWIVEIDPAGLTLAEICERALAWMDREKLRASVARNGSHPAVSHTKPVESAKCWGFSGSRDWENWGVGFDVEGGWHLFHFSRTQGAWKRHNHATLTIPSGIPYGLARQFCDKCRHTPPRRRPCRVESACEGRVSRAADIEIGQGTYESPAPGDSRGRETRGTPTGRDAGVTAQHRLALASPRQVRVCEPT